LPHFRSPSVAFICRNTERAALLEAKAAWSLDGARNATLLLDTWSNRTCPCHSAWHGVSCRKGRVHALDLTALGNLIGGPPQCLSALSALSGL
jgi:hypothetical protein